MARISQFGGIEAAAQQKTFQSFMTNFGQL